MGRVKKNIRRVYLKMINLDDARGENIKEGNPNWPQTRHYSYRILILGSSGFGKTNTLFNLI